MIRLQDKARGKKELIRVEDRDRVVDYLSINQTTDPDVSSFREAYVSRRIPSLSRSTDSSLGVPSPS